MHTGTDTHTYIHTDTHTCRVHTHMHTHKTCTHRHTHRDTDTHIETHKYTHSRTYKYRYTCIHVCMLVYVCTHIHTVYVHTITTYHTQVEGHSTLCSTGNKHYCFRPPYIHDNRWTTSSHQPSYCQHSVHCLLDEW